MGCGSSKFAAGIQPSSILPPTSLDTGQRRIIENFVVIWLDAQLATESSKINTSTQRSVNSLKRIVNELQMFSAIEPCIIFLNNIRCEKVFIIVSGSLGEQFVPRVHSLPQIAYIYIFCSNRIHHEKWAEKYSKIKGVFTTIDTICDHLKLDVKLRDRVLNEFEVLNRRSDQDIDKLESAFIYSQLVKEILLHDDGESDPQFDKTDMISFCRVQYANNPAELSIINEFEHNRDPSKTPIWFYTSESFLYKMLNYALRMRDLDTLYNLRFFLRQLHKQLTHLFRSDAGLLTDMALKLPQGKTSLIIVYRGQGMSQNDFEKLKDSQGGFLTFNNFLSTSSSEKMGMSFAQQARDTDDSSIVPLLMHIEIGIECFFPTSIIPILSKFISDREKLEELLENEDELSKYTQENFHLSPDAIKEMAAPYNDPSSNIMNCPFAEISHLSAFPTESEVLFSSSTIFRIHKVQRETHGIWGVHLSMTNDGDEKLRSSLKYYRRKCAGRHPLHRLAKLLFHMGQIDESEQFYLRLLDNSNMSVSTVARDNYTRARCHIELGNILRIKKQYEQALEHIRKGRDIVTIILATKEVKAPEVKIIISSMNLLMFKISRDCGLKSASVENIFSVMEELLALLSTDCGQESFELFMVCLIDALQVCIQCTDDDDSFEKIQKIWLLLPAEFHTENPTTATIHHQFAMCFEQRNIIQKALEEAEKALVIARNVLLSDDPQINVYKQHVDKLRRKLSG